MSKDFKDFVNLIDSSKLQPLREAEAASESSLDKLPITIRRIAIRDTLDVLEAYHRWINEPDQ